MGKRFTSSELLIFSHNTGKNIYRHTYIYIYNILKTLIFRTKKKFEFFFKTVTQGGGISCKPPDEYSERFKHFISDIFK